MVCLDKGRERFQAECAPEQHRKPKAKVRRVSRWYRPWAVTYRRNVAGRWVWAVRSFATQAEAVDFAHNSWHL